MDIQEKPLDDGSGVGTTTTLPRTAESEYAVPCSQQISSSTAESRGRSGASLKQNGDLPVGDSSISAEVDVPQVKADNSVQYSCDSSLLEPSTSKEGPLSDGPTEHSELNKSHEGSAYQSKDSIGVGPALEDTENAAVLESIVDTEFEGSSEIGVAVPGGGSVLSQGVLLENKNSQHKLFDAQAFPIFASSVITHAADVIIEDSENKTKVEQAAGLGNRAGTCNKSETGSGGEEDSEEEENEGEAREAETDSDPLSESSSSRSSSDEEEEALLETGSPWCHQTSTGSKQRNAASDEEEESVAPLRTKHELVVLPPVPAVEAELLPSHVLEPLGHIVAVLGTLVVVQAAEGVRALDEGSTLWLAGERMALGLVDEVFGPVKAPLYQVRHNSPADIPASALPQAPVAYVAAFARFVLNDVQLYQKGYDASGLDDEELPDGATEFSDDEKEAEAKRARSRAKRKPDSAPLSQDKQESCSPGRRQAAGEKDRSRGRGRGRGRGGQEIPAEGPRPWLGGFANGAQRPGAASAVMRPVLPGWSPLGRPPLQGPEGPWGPSQMPPGLRPANVPEGYPWNPQVQYNAGVPATFRGHLAAPQDPMWHPGSMPGPYLHPPGGYPFYGSQQHSQHPNPGSYRPS